MLNDSEGNAKRTMLLGTALLTTLESLGARTDFKDLSDIRNAGLILAHFLVFAQSMNSSCRLNENGWKHRVLEKADELAIVVGGVPGIEEMLAEIRNVGDNGDLKDTTSGEASNAGGSNAGGSNAGGSNAGGSNAGDSNEESSAEEWSTDSDFDDFDNCLLCYKPKPWVAVLTLESLKAGIVRKWRYFNWLVEV